MAKSRRRRESKLKAELHSNTPTNTIPLSEDFDDEGSLSTLSTLSETTLLSEHRDNLSALSTTAESVYIDTLHEHAAHLSDRRPSVRRAASVTIWKILTRVVISPQGLEGIIDTVIDGLIRGGIRKGNVEERKEACRTLMALWVTVGGVEDGDVCGWERIKEVLMKVGEASCVECLGMGCFLWEEEPEEIQGVLGYLEKVFEREKGKNVAVASIKAWLLVLTSLSAREVVGRVEENERDVGSVLVRLAVSDGAQPAVRIAAAEALNYVAECDENNRGGQEMNGAEEEEESEHSAIDRITSALENISVADEGQGTRTGKGDRQWRKQLYQAADRSKGYSETVKAGRTTLVASGVGELRRLEAIRSVLGGGLAVHVRDNPLMHSMFTVKVPFEYESRDHQKVSTGMESQVRRDRRRARNIEKGKRRRSHWAEMEVLTGGGDSD